MGPKKKRGKKKKKAKEEPLKLTDETKTIVEQKLMEHRILQLSESVAALEVQNRDLKSYAIQKLEDKEDIIQGITKKSLQHQSCIDKLKEEQTSIENQKDKLQTELSMQIATQERELHETKERLRASELESADFAAQLEAANEKIVANSGLQESLEEARWELRLMKASVEDSKKCSDIMDTVNSIKSLIPMIVKAMESMPSNVSLQIESCTSLQQLAKDSKMAKDIISLGTIPFVLAGLQQHRGNLSYETVAVRLIWKLSYDSQGRAQVLDEDGVSRLLKVIDSRPYRNAVRLYGNVCNAIRVLLPPSCFEKFKPTSSKDDTPSELADEVSVFLACAKKYGEPDGGSVIFCVTLAIKSIFEFNPESVSHLVLNKAFLSFLSEVLGADSSSISDNRRTVKILTVLEILSIASASKAVQRKVEKFRKISASIGLVSTVVQVFKATLGMTDADNDDVISDSRHFELTVKPSMIDCTSTVLGTLGLDSVPRDVRSLLLETKIPTDAAANASDATSNLPMTTKLIGFTPEPIVLPKIFK